VDGLVAFQFGKSFDGFSGLLPGEAQVVEALLSSASSSSARCSPGWIAVTAIAILRMIVNNLNVRWARRPIGPLEANPPLVVYADAVLALAVA